METNEVMCMQNLGDNERLFFTSEMTSARTNRTPGLVRTVSETYILVDNASASDGSVRVTLYFEDGSTATKMFPLAANRRINVNVGVEFPWAGGRRFGAIVESAGATPASPIIVERSVYSTVEPLESRSLRSPSEPMEVGDQCEAA